LIDEVQSWLAPLKQAQIQKIVNTKW